MKFRAVSLVVILLLLLLTSCNGTANTPATPQPGACAPNSIEISIIYAPESEQYMPRVIADFNSAFTNGRNPVSGSNLASGERPICVTGVAGSSGTVMQGIVNAIIAPTNQNVARPTIFQPSVSHWLALANFQSGREIFDLANTQVTALAPVVIAIWESRLRAIQDTIGSEDVGWEDLIAVLNSPNGWQDYGIANGRRSVFYGHTDPMVSSTGLSTLIAEFYASARQNGFTDRRLTLEAVRDTDIQAGVRQIESLIRHYSTRTTEFKEYIAQGPEYLDFVALEENDLIYINRGLTQYQPPERLVALYPKEGMFWHEHPMGIVNAQWVSAEQRDAARVFINYVLTPEVQTIIMAEGFRPANPDVELAFPFVPENGIDVTQPRTVLDVPDPAVIAAIQQSWSFVKKQADILLLMDISGSMNNESKMQQAIDAALVFLDNMEPTNRVGLAVFSDEVELLIPLQNFESIDDDLRAEIDRLRADGGTELYQAVAEMATMMTDLEGSEDRIQAIVLLSDGANTGDSGATLSDAVVALEASRNALNPLIMIPVAYGSDADINALNALARASNTRVASGDPQSILGVLQIISSYF
ncbi:MAG: substrate-binding domain-containing protein [Anaerolinea sp.]|nr:substrate-binding domain-containing protein [Anaerolinea sp.]